jgi:phospholipase/carboxylesterase
VSIEARLRPAAGEPAGALVLMHGRGVDEQDLFPLLDVLDPARRLLGAAPRGPLTMAPGGRHWYGPVRRVGYPDHDTFHATYAALADWLGSLGVPPESTVLGGFSQGAVMAWALALGRGRPAPAGILALSGFLPTVEDFELDLAGREGLPAAIGHGTHDPIIGVEWGRDARDRLLAAGADVLYRESPMGHSVDPRFLAEAGEWLREAIPATGASAER